MAGAEHPLIEKPIHIAARGVLEGLHEVVGIGALEFVPVQEKA